ncbi:WecB/TagA/CpsF family glycosyltransferase [Brevundimonas sp. SORGH_AS_0993]|uniref:WecB/TagA/CpsF family glycosyltransferase n=1 Tax=Brevundimonas sp. SORGH_AS_0993 TaxID=3041794 RepID=UPI00277DB0D1|nr:WecB/TagA/CpsF family glycosyltransferase [Brevundimonas sp. SORGH_AS_0993]MDQ1154384.1 N-acetylglucosaminyldiphosphoundecaprenol N-acetyl-beta-D-mannosaminyltransferase [Brevundimonas sp. SORGH_AS_0993]
MTETSLPSHARDRRAAPRRAFRKARRSRERVRLLGQAVDLVKPEEVMHHLQQAVAEGRKSLIANHNLHSLYLLTRRPELQTFYDRADMVEVDSTPLLWFSRALGLHSRPFHRCTYLDWRDHFWSLADRKAWRVLSVGGAPGVGEAAAAKLAARYPDAEIRTRHGYFEAAPGSADNAAVLAEIADFRPHILFVGMGMPRQELWIADHFDALPDCVVLSVGAAFDYEAGVQKAAPRWMGRAGIEWAYRLFHDPQRLFVRYCVEPWFLLPLIVADIRTALRRHGA